MAKDNKNPAKRTMRGVRIISENEINNLKAALVTISF